MCINWVIKTYFVSKNLIEFLNRVRNRCANRNTSEININFLNQFNNFIEELEDAYYNKTYIRGHDCVIKSWSTNSKKILYLRLRDQITRHHIEIITPNDRKILRVEVDTNSVVIKYISRELRYGIIIV